VFVAVIKPLATRPLKIIRPEVTGFYDIAP
jgi:hypothetical protein